MRNNIVKVSKLRQSFNGHDVFFDFKFNLTQGDSVLLQGDNGSGKTTILKILSGLLEPTQGEFIFEGNPATNYKQVRSKLITQSIYLHQQPYLFDTSVENNLTYAYTSATALTEPQRADLIYQLGLEGLCSKNAANLSIGQKQRVALARSLLYNPRLLILDEPFTAVDKDSYTRIVNALEYYKNNGGTILLVSHQHDRDFELINKCWCIHPRGVLFCVSAD